jgi:alanine dehydrogenase
MATQLQESKLDEILNSIRKNALELADSRYTDIQMIKTAVNRGTKLLNGKITEQDVVDIGAIGLALILRRI